jgi:glycosyltransferase involved in cell wall biosynthesis
VKVALIDPLGFTTPYDDRLAATLGQLGHDVHLLTAPFLLDRAPAANGYTREELFVPVSSRLLRRTPRARARRILKGIEYLPSVRRLVRRIDALAPDVAHVQWLARPELDVRWLRRIARARPTLLTAHNAFPRRERAYGAWREALETVDRVVVHSTQTLDRLAEFGIEREHMTLIPHAVFDAPVEQPVVEPVGKTLLFFGLIRRYKGLDLLVSALPEIVSAVPEARLVVAGDPLDPIEPTRQLAAALGVDGAIQWRLGFIPDGELAPLLASTTLVVLPYREIESSGVLALALGHGRPAVVSDLGAVGETVRDFGAGRAVPPEDAHALARACVELLQDRGALREAFEGALTARDTLTWAAAAEAHDALYRALTARPSERVLSS